MTRPREGHLFEAVDVVAGRHLPFEIWNSGIRRLDEAAVVFDVHRVASGEPNAALIDLAADVATAVQPLLRPVDSLAAEFGEVEAFIDDHYGVLPISPSPRIRPVAGDEHRPLGVRDHRVLLCSPREAVEAAAH